MLDCKEFRRRRKQERYREACNTIFSDAFRGGLLRRLARELEHPKFPWDAEPDSMYASLFRNHGDAALDIRRQTYLEFWGAQGRPRVLRVLHRFLPSCEAGGAEYEAMRKWIRAFEDIGEIVEDEPPNFAEVAWAVEKLAWWWNVDSKAA